MVVLLPRRHAWRVLRLRYCGELSPEGCQKISRSWAQQSFIGGHDVEQELYFVLWVLDIVIEMIRCFDYAVERREPSVVRRVSEQTAPEHQ